MRRAHLVAAPIEGGVLGQVRDLVCFDPLGPPDVVLPPWPGLDRAARALATAGATVVRRAPAPRPGGAGEWQAARPVDLVHVHFASSHDATAAVAAALGAGIAVVSTEHACPDAEPMAGERGAGGDPTRVRPRPGAPGPEGRHVWQERRRLAPRQAVLLADSRAVAEPLAARLGVPVRVALHGIDLRHFEALPSQPAARHALGLPDAARVVGCVGALFSSKGVHRLVEAVARLGAPVVLAVVGEGPERPRLVAEAAARGVDLRLLGWQEDVRTALAAFDVFALASDSEGLPTCVLEAMAAGVPVVASDLPGVAEAVGECARLVPSADIGAWRAALEEALDGGLWPLVAPGRERVGRLFDVRRLAAEVARAHAQACCPG